MVPILFRPSVFPTYVRQTDLLAAEPLPKIARVPPTRKHELAEVIILDIKPTNRLHICVSMPQSLQIIGNRLQCVLYVRRITLRTHVVIAQCIWARFECWSVSLNNQPFSRYKVVKNCICIEWPNMKGTLFIGQKCPYELIFNRDAQILSCPVQAGRSRHIIHFIIPHRLPC